MPGALAARPGSPGSALPGHGVHEVAGALLRVPPSVAPVAPLLVFFHGAGGSGLSALRHVQAAADAAGVLVLAPSSVGATWDLLSGRLGQDLAALDVALEQVFSLHPVDRVAIGGFSDGASYALSVGLANGDLAEALLAFSPGFLAPPDQVGRPRVWVAHGRGDAVLPVERCGRRVVGQLQRAGYDVRYEEFDGGHVVRPEDVVEALNFWRR